MIDSTTKILSWSENPDSKAEQAQARAIMIVAILKYIRKGIYTSLSFVRARLP